ncbi:MAG: vWA domain-containing protein [Caldilineaceae bacterium]
MKLRRLATGLAFLLLSASLFWVTTASTLAAPRARQSQQTPPLAEQPLAEQNGDVTQPIDVVVLLDDSGSMATCWPWPQNRPPFNPPCGYPSENPPSDPDELRYSAARLLLQLADDNDRIAVVRFDNLAAGVGDLGLLQPVGAGENRRRLTESLVAPTDYFARGYTRIDLGLQMAIDLLKGARQPGRNQYVLLLTDGEPSQPSGAGSQRDRINEQIVELDNVGVLTYPVVLCNPTAGCAGEFLKARFAESGVREAKSAQDLVRVFSEIFVSMKSDRSVLTGRNAKGALAFTTRAPQGVRKITLVTPRAGLTNIRRDDQPLLPQNVLNDPNIDVNVIEGEAIGAGAWTAETSDFSGFAVIQTNSYPELLNPPPSLAGSAASTRYYPAGKPLLLLARSGGPGASEPLYYNGKTVLKPFGQGDLKSLLLTETPDEIRLQLGDDKAPLQLVRSFHLEARRDLPKLDIFSPRPDNSGMLENGHLRLQVGFSGNVQLQNMAATAFVTDQSQDEQGKGKLVYQATLTCNNRTCLDENFVPGDGRSYQVTYLIEAQKDGLRFSDWGQSDLALKPAVYVRGLPPLFDLAQMPAEGWPLEIGSGTTEEIGSLSATLSLQRLESEEDAVGTSLNFMVDVPENGAVTAPLLVDGLTALRPGTYSGEITLQVNSPAGRPMDVDIRPMRTIPVEFFVPRPVAHIDTQEVNFGEVLFDTSPNFRLDQQSMLPLIFEGNPFDFTVTMQENSCSDVRVAPGALQRQEGSRALLPLQLNSRGPIQPGLCAGKLLLSGPTGDYDVFPQEVHWQTRVNNIEWSVVSTALNLKELQDAGAQVKATLLVRFSGKTPFVLQMEKITVGGRDQEGEVTLSSAELEMPPVEVNGPPTEAGLYEVPFTLIARQPIPFDPMRGTFYNGELSVGVVGLESEPQAIGLSFVSPGLAQRYLAPYLLPVYSMPWVVCTGPLTLFVLLVLVARIRGRNIDEDELEEAAVASTFAMSSAPEAAAPAAPPLAFETPVQNEGAWGADEWGSSGAWGNATTSTTQSSAGNTTYKPNGSAEADPWKTGW